MECLTLRETKLKNYVTLFLNISFIQFTKLTKHKIAICHIWRKIILMRELNTSTKIYFIVQWIIRWRHHWFVLK